MNVLSLFDGISCARVALEKAGLPITTYYASEIDEQAKQIAQKNHPSTIQLGDVKIVNTPMLLNKHIDLLVGGSPCQDLSIAKKNREGLAGSRSGLFYEYLRILREVKPKYFILENVASMPPEAKDEISKQLGVEPIMINAAIVSAQNRKRLFWTNIPNVQLPTDKEIYLKHVIHENTDKADITKFVVNPTTAEKPRAKQATKTEDQKANCLSATMHKGAQANGMTLIKVMDKHGKEEKLKSNTVRVGGRGSGIQSKQNWDMIRVGHFNKGGQGDRVYSPEGKSVCLSANGGGRGAKTGLYLINEYVRKLTPVECERLQGLPDGYTEGLSNTLRYKALGNAFHVDVIAHILSHIAK